MSIINIILATSGFGAGLYALLRLNQATELKLDTAWADAARTVRGTYAPASGPWYRRTPRIIEATIDRIAVVADSYVVSQGKSSAAYTRLTAPAPNSHGVALSVYREDVFTSVGKVLGAQDVVVGDPPFDDLFVVKANVEDVARAWLRGGVNAALRACPDFRYELDNGTLRAICPGLLDDPDKLARALRVVAKLAARGNELKDEWAALASRAGGVVRQPLSFARAELGSFAVNRGGTEFVVAVERDERTLVTTVSAPVALTLDADAEAKLTEAVGNLPLARLQLGQAPSAIALRGILRDADALDRLLEAFAEALGDRSIGPYR